MTETALAKLEKENVYICGWMHCFKYTDLGNEIIFNFTTINGSYRHTGKATRNEIGITLTMTTDNNFSHDGTMRPHSVTFSRIYSVGRIVHILANRYWHTHMARTVTLRDEKFKPKAGYVTLSKADWILVEFNDFWRMRQSSPTLALLCSDEETRNIT